jgi:O-antigen/teichoic acid export membrane protein
MSNAVVAEVRLAEQVSNSRTVGKNAIWNMLGRSVPMLVAVAVTPHLIKEFGVDRWGVFTIALSLVGAFGMFDFGIGRALTRNVAGAIGAGVHGEMASQAKTSLLTLLILGSMGDCSWHPSPVIGSPLF